MAGLMTPYRAERIVKALNAEIGLPVHLHCHYVGGMAPANYLKAAEAACPSSTPHPLRWLSATPSPPSR